MRYLLLLLSFSLFLYGSDKLVLIANKNFPVDHLTKNQVKQIYLKRITLINGVSIVPINYIAQNRLRKKFEKKILRLSPKKLKRYWMKEHYLGKRPPIVQSSIKSAIIFVRKVDGAIAYIPYSKLPLDVVVLYKEEL